SLIYLDPPPAPPPLPPFPTRRSSDLDPELQDRMFRALGFTEEKARASFGFLMDAYKYGAPPHGGMAYGLDRMVMLMLGRDSIRDVIAFPKVQNAGEPMSGAPDVVDEKQLGELSIALALPPKD